MLLKLYGRIYLLLQRYIQKCSVFRISLVVPSPTRFHACETLVDSVVLTPTRSRSRMVHELVGVNEWKAAEALVSFGSCILPEQF